MQQILGHTRCPWKLPSGDYSLRIAPAAARATDKQQQSTNTPKKVAMFMAAAVHQYNTMRIARWRRSRALLEATGRRHRASIMSNNIKPDMATTVCFDVFIVKTIGKGHGLTLRPLFSIGVLHIKRKRRA
jgi:hypothetical protein